MSIDSFFAAKRILITGARSPVAINIASQLMNVGKEVYFTDCISFALATKAFGKELYTQTLAPRYHYEDYIRQVNQIVMEEQIDWILPTCEEVFYLSAAKDQLKVPVFTMDSELLAKLHHKFQFAEYMLAIGKHAPKTLLLAQQNSFPMDSEMILKPIYSRFSSVNKKLLPKDISKKENYIMQEYKKGKEWCVYAIAIDGQTLDIIIYSKAINYRQSASLYFAHHYKPDLEKEVQEICHELNFTGQIGFDVIETTDGTYWYIDCNPRSTSGVSLINDHVWLGENSVLKSKKQPRAITLLAVLVALKNPKQLREIVKATDQLKDSPQKISIWTQMSQLYHWFKLSRQVNISLTSITTWGIEWNGEKL